MMLITLLSLVAAKQFSSDLRLIPLSIPVKSFLEAIATRNTFVLEALSNYKSFKH